MSAGASGSYAVNGTEFLIQPTSGRWMPKSMMGISGDGHALYPTVREFEVRFNITTPALLNQLQAWFESIIILGTAVVDLPKYGDANYIFYSYTGCVLREPEMNAYFIENHSDVIMTICNIRT